MDLRTPATNPTGILDSMGVAHMVGEPAEILRDSPREAAAEALARIEEEERFVVHFDVDVIVKGG